MTSFDMKFNPFSKAPPAPEVFLTPEISHANLKTQAPELIIPNAVLLKKLKWVVHQNRVGIVTELDSSGYAKLDLVDSDGITVDSIRVANGELRLARYMEIPKNRRPTNPQYAAVLGYC